MKIPQEISAGDSAEWPDNPSADNAGNVISSAEYTLKYALRGATVLDLTAVADGSGWKTSITTTQSAALTAGIYFWQAYAEKSGVRVTLGTGKLKVTPNLATASGVFDGRSQAKKNLDAVRAAIEANMAGGAVAEYSIGGRSVRKIPVADLILLEQKFATEVAREAAAEAIKNGRADPRNVFVRFTK